MFRCCCHFDFQFKHAGGVADTDFAAGFGSGAAEFVDHRAFDHCRCCDTNAAGNGIGLVHGCQRLGTRQKIDFVSVNR